MLFCNGINRAKVGVEPTAFAHEAEILPLNYFAINFMRLHFCKKKG